MTFSILTTSVRLNWCTRSLMPGAWFTFIAYMCTTCNQLMCAHMNNPDAVHCVTQSSLNISSLVKLRRQKDHCSHMIADLVHMSQIRTHSIQNTSFYLIIILSVASCWLFLPYTICVSSTQWSKKRKRAEHASWIWYALMAASLNPFLVINCGQHER